MTTTCIYFTEEEMEDFISHTERFNDSMKKQIERMDALILYILFGDREENNELMVPYNQRR